MPQEWSEEEIKEQIRKSAKAESVKETSQIYKRPSIVRNLLLIGCGDGGCNIMSAIHTAIPETYAIAYNTSPKAMDLINATVKIIPDETDGSGKVRSYSQNIFKQGSYKILLNDIDIMIEESKNTYQIEYIIVIATSDGGTGGGISPMAAKFIADNVDIPVIIMGVYPDLADDATAQFNAMCWQQDVAKTELPYIILDNNFTVYQNAIYMENSEGKGKSSIHRVVNDHAVEIAKIISGKYFGESTISMIDNRDMYMLLSQIGKRIAVFGEYGKLAVNQTVDDFLSNVILKWPEPAPYNETGIGLFVKGPKDYLNKLNVQLSDFHSKYGDVVVQYIHLEESKEQYIAIICSGCSEPMDRLMKMRERYDDITNRLNETESTVSSILEGTTSLLGISNTKKKNRENGKLDESALDL